MSNLLSLPLLNSYSLLFLTLTIFRTLQSASPKLMSNSTDCSLDISSGMKFLFFFFIYFSSIIYFQLFSFWIDLYFYIFKLFGLFVRIIIYIILYYSISLLWAFRCILFLAQTLLNKLYIYLPHANQFRGFNSVHGIRPSFG